MNKAKYLACVFIILFHFIIQFLSWSLYTSTIWAKHVWNIFGFPLNVMPDVFLDNFVIEGMVTNSLLWGFALSFVILRASRTRVP